MDWNNKYLLQGDAEKALDNEYIDDVYEYWVTNANCRIKTDL